MGARNGAHWKAWGELLPISASYAACYEIAYYLSDSHFLLTAGLRLSCLLLLSRRFWPALVMGEFIPLFEVAMLCLSKFGWAWAVVVSTPTVLLYMTWFKPMSAKLAFRAPDGNLRMGVLVSAALLAALTNALRDTGAVAAILISSTKDWGTNISLPSAFSAFLLGAISGR